MAYRIAISSEFCAAMQLNMDGPCNNLHGHTYLITAEFSAEQLNEHGIIADYYELKQELDKITSKIDHKFLNEHPWFAKLMPSSENIAFVIYQQLKAIYPILTQISVQESNNCVVSYAK